MNREEGERMLSQNDGPMLDALKRLNGDLPAGYRTRESLFPGRFAGPVRRIHLVRQNTRGFETRELEGLPDTYPFDL